MNRQLESVHVSSRVQYIIALAIVLLAAFALRIWLLGDQNIWWDEGLAIWAVRQGWMRMTLWTASDVHPPLYFWLLQVWVRLAGESEFAARFISLICGVVTVAALYTLGKILLGQQVALLGTVLLASSRFHVWWSQEMRMYIVATMWGVLSIYTLLRWFRAEDWIQTAEAPTRRRHPALQAMLYVVATAAGLYTLYLFITVVLIENVFSLVLLLSQSVRKRTHFLRRWALAQLAVLMLFVPWLALALPRMHSWSVATSFDFTLFLRLYATLLTLGISTYIERYTWLVLPFFFIIVAAAITSGHIRGSPLHGPSRGFPKATAVEMAECRQAAFLLALLLFIPPLLVYAVTRPRSLFYAPNVEARYLLLFAPAFYLLLAWSLILLYRQARWVGLGALAFTAATFVWTLPVHYVGRYLRDEHQTMVRIIAAYAQPGDAVLLVSGSRYPVFDYYYGRLPAGSIRPSVYVLPQHGLQISHDNVDQELAPLAAAHPRLWLAQVNAPMEDPQGLVADWLDQRYSQVLSFGFAHNALTLYAPAGAVARMSPGNLTPQYSLAALIGSGSTLLGYDLPTRQFRPGDTIRLALYCSSKNGATVTVRMVDQRGRVLEQRQSTLPPADSIARQQLDFTVYAYTPGGFYHFEVESPDDGRNQPVLFGTLRVAATKALPLAGAPPVVLFAGLEDGIELLGYALTNATGQPARASHAGETLTLDLYWRARHKPSHNYTVFAHLVGRAYNPATAGPVWAGHDGQPLASGYPTAQWFVNETIVDRHLLTLDTQAPAGEYELEAGMYLLETMKRLSVVDAQGRVVDNRIVLDRFQIVPP